MATFQQWVEGARLRTLPLAVAPVLLGTGAALGVLGGLSALVIGSMLDDPDPDVSLSFLLLKAALALIVSLALQIGSN